MTHTGNCCLALTLSPQMSSYNRVNGAHVSESDHLLRTVLRGQLEFDSLLMSDWAGTYSSSEAVKSSLDLEMPGPSTMRGAALERDILSTKLSLEELDDCVLRVSSPQRELLLTPTSVPQVCSQCATLWYPVRGTREAH